jgi:hypothetical protein
MALDSADLLASIIADGHIAVPIVRLCERLNATPAEIRRPARDLVKRGVVALWNQCPDGPAVCLTPATVEQLDLEPDDAGRRWIPRGSRRRPDRLHASRRAVRECDVDLDGASVFDLVADEKATDPHRAADYNESLRIAHQAAEEAVECEPKWSTYRTDAVNKVRYKIPQRIVGSGVQWPVPFTPGERCLCCHSIEGSFICIICCSSSVDPFVGKPPSQATLDRQAGRFVATDSKGRKLRGGIGKARAV